jgi:DNA-binding MurR/RpiR family transcriptional regulator
MGTKQEVANLPKAIAETLATGQAEYEVVLRRIRWGEGPIYLLGNGTSRYACLTGVHAFETLPGWPAVARSPADFAAYSTALLKPGVVVIAISSSSERSAILEVARAARARGASLLVLTNQPESALTEIAGGVLRLRTDSEGSGATVCEQTAMSYLGLLAARIFKKHQPQLEVLEEEFRRLPGETEAVLHQMSDAVRSFASQLAAFRRVYVLGGGFYHPSALQAEHLFQELGGSAQALDPTELGCWDFPAQDAVLLAVSGSRCRVKKRIHEVLKRAGNSGVKVVSITDSNDRELTELSALAVLLPSLTEMVGAVLASVLIHCLGYQTACNIERTGEGKPRARAFGRGSGAPMV